MEAQCSFSRFCPNLSVSFFRSPKLSFLLKLPSASSCSFARSSVPTSPSVWLKKNVGVKKNSQMVVRVSLEGEVSRTVIRRKKLAVFVSGGGSNFRSIHEASLEGSINGDIVVLVTNKIDCGGAEYARSKNIPVILFPKTKDEPDRLSPSDLVANLRRLEIDFILLAGYLKLIPLELIQAYSKSILNIHPSLLPAFGGKGYYGMKVHKSVIASGARYSGPTIHFVDEHFDTGRILAQRVVPVLANDAAQDLAARVLKEEHCLYVEVVAALCEERIVWREDGVPLIQSKENPNEFL
ncbi:phosphoribosylglycinamide formyltransferase, chloroplastic [Momordica charantia]|uniref:Phosphoribosylglycinamide formyltransferase, chloroplastic n=1 Tax=Momordica charantia TaxID=3673 RepID=A0A6J1DNE2_MOMCH|nr:phosphoribosylglycinamide formyltransferase, chloroplastic [Momordica charantia]